MYLRRILTDGVISFLVDGNGASPDFVIETGEKPVLLGLGKNETTVNHRYRVLISGGTISPSLEENCIRLPLSWFALL
jgi:hypothetical protein